MAVEYLPIPEPTGTTPAAWIKNFRAGWENWKLARLASNAQYFTSTIPAGRTFAQIVTSIGSNATTIWVNSTVSIAANLTIPSNIHIIVLKGGSFSISTGVTLTINGPFEAWLYRVFSGLGSAAFGAGSVPYVLPEWWHDGTSNWRPAIIAAYTTGFPVKLAKQTYTCDFTLGNFLLPSGAHIFGEGFASVIESTSADARPFQNANRTGPTLVDEDIVLHNFRIKNNAGGSSSEFSSCFDLRYIKGLTVTKMWLQESAGDAGTLRGNEDVFVQNIRCKDNGRQGIAVTLGKRITLDSIYGEDVALSVVDIEPNSGDTIETINISNIYDLGGVGNGALNVFSDTDDSIIDINVQNVDCGREFICTRVLRGSFRDLTVTHGALSDDAAFVFASCKQIEIWGLKNRDSDVAGAKLKISSCEDVQGGDFHFLGPGSAANGHCMELLGNLNVQLVNVSMKELNTQGLWARNNVSVRINGLLLDGATQYGILLNPTSSNTSFQVMGYVPTNVTGSAVRLDQGSGTNLGIYIDADYTGASSSISIAGGGLLTWVSPTYRGLAADSIVSTSSTYKLATPGPTMDSSGMPIWTAGIKIDGGTGGVRRTWFDATSGITHRAGTGSSYDWALLSQASAYLIRNLTGTSTLEFPALVSMLDDIAISTAGKGLRVKEGSSARMGTATLVGGTVVVNNTSVTANTRIFYSVQAPGGTQGHLSVARTAATSFTFTSTSGTDTSVIAWMLVEPA